MMISDPHTTALVLVDMQNDFLHPEGAYGRNGQSAEAIGGVASTLRDAHVRDFHCIVLEDGCAAFDAAAHESSIGSLSTLAEITSCRDALSALA